jgi:transposase InsO family protein
LLEHTKSLIGTVQWYITDDERTTHSIILPNTSYVPSADIRMLSPQHWAQVTNDLRGTQCVTYGDCFLLKWDKKRFRKTIPISPSLTKNVGIMTSACGNNPHQSLCNDLEAGSPTLAFSSTIDFNSEAATAPDTDSDISTTVSTSLNIRSPNTEESTQHPLLVTFRDELDKLEQHPTLGDKNQEYMHWHYRLSHASFPTMLSMAKSKLLPQEITSILKGMARHRQKPPLCSDCICSKMCRKQWKQKDEKAKKPNARARLLPGDIVSVDQLVSSTPGLIACLHGGQPTHERYLGSTVFVDQGSDFSYIFHHTTLNSAQTVKAKQAFETEAKRHGVTIKHYHADNGLFRTKLFMEDIAKKGQTTSFAGVGAHHQNGIAEKRIGDQQRKATTLLLHAQRRWPDAINTDLRPYAIRCANETRNTCPTKASNISPLNRFCQSDKRPPYRHQHHFGCPVYVLNKDIQDGKKERKWTDRTRIGINLGPSPRHASAVALILNLNTGLVSPQFHCQYDDLFESTTGSQARSIPRSHWQVKCGFSPQDITEDEGDQTSPTGQSEPN